MGCVFYTSSVAIVLGIKPVDNILEQLYLVVNFGSQLVLPADTHTV